MKYLLILTNIFNNVSSNFIKILNIKYFIFRFLLKTI
jgi:hypothetical protein